LEDISVPDLVIKVIRPCRMHGWGWGRERLSI